MGVINWLRRALSCCCSCFKSGADDSGSSVWKPPENMTEEALIRLIHHLLALLQSLKSNSSDATPQQMDSSDTWKEYTAGIPKCLECLASRSRKEAAEDIGKNTFLPLLVKVLEGIGSLQWAAFAFSMLAFAIDNLDRKHENFKDFLDVIQGTVLLLENTKGMWLSDGITLSSGSDGNEPLHSTDIQKIADMSLRICVIFASCNTNINASRRCLEKLVAYLGADSLAVSINTIKRETDSLMLRAVSIAENTPQPYLIPSNMLDITWGSVSQYWNRSYSVTRSWCSEVSYLKAVCWLEVHSKFEREFRPGNYLVSFRIRFHDIRGFTWSPVKLTMSVLTSDDRLIMQRERFRYLQGDQAKIVDDAKIAPLRSVGDDWLELEVGRLNIENKMSLKVHIQMKEIESNQWKSGLIIDCVKLTKVI